MPRPARQFTPDTTLAATALWPEAVVRRLGMVWITTVGAVLGASVSDQSRRALAEQAGLDEPTLQKLLVATAAGLSAADRAHLSNTASTLGRGLGALPPKSD